jgi:hypothetical protein
MAAGIECQRLQFKQRRFAAVHKIPKKKLAQKRRSSGNNTYFLTLPLTLFGRNPSRVYNYIQEGIYLMIRTDISE